MDFVTLAEIRLSGGTIYAATAPNQDDGTNAYEYLLPEHPVIRRSLSEENYGIVREDDVRLELAALEVNPGATANTIANRFRTTEGRGTRVILRRKNLTTGDAPVEIYTGIVQRVAWLPEGRVSLSLASQLPELLSAASPRVLIQEANYPSAAAAEGFDLQLPVPYHFGAHREHAPARYVEATAALFRYRYVVAADFATGNGVPMRVRPYPVSVYRGSPNGVLLVPEPEYEVVHNQRLSDYNSAGLVAFAGTGGFLAQPKTYRYALAMECGGITAVVGQSADVVTSASLRTGVLQWPISNQARSYYLFRQDVTDGGAMTLLCILPAQMDDDYGGGWVTFQDNGATFPERGLLAAPTVNSTTHSVELLFRRQQSVSGDTPVPILIDADWCDFSRESNTVGLWSFRRRWFDRSNRSNHPIRSDVQVCWAFPGAYVGSGPRTLLTSETGNNTLVAQGGVGVRSYRLGGIESKGGLWLNGTAHYCILAHGSQTGLDGGTTSFRWDGWINPDAGSVQIPWQCIVAKYWNGTVGWALFLNYGKLHAIVHPSGGSPVTVTGTIPIDGAPHHVALIVDRTAQTVSLEVDFVADGSPVAIGSAATLSNTDQVSVGFVASKALSYFKGVILWLQRSTTLTTPNFGPGPGLGSVSAIRTGFSPPLYIPDGRTADCLSNALLGDFTVDVLFSTTTTASQVMIVLKYDAVALAGFALQMNAGGALQARLIRPGGLEDSVTSAAITANTWIYASMRRQGSTLSLTVNGVTVSAACSTASLANTGDFVIGAQTAAGAIPLNGWIAAVRMTGGTGYGPAVNRRAWGMIVRNPVTAMRALLQSATFGPGGTLMPLNETSWDAAEDTIAALTYPLEADGAVVEQRTLGDVLAEFLKLRGMALSLNSAGELLCTVDTAGTASAIFGWRDGEYENLVSRPNWESLALREALTELVCRYRRRRRATGEVDRYLLETSVRTVSAVGQPDPAIVELPMVRSRRTADVVAHYQGAYAALRDLQVDLEAGEDALALAPGSIVRVRDATSGLADQHVRVTDLEIDGSGQVQISGHAWTGAPYSYIAGTLPTEIASETRPDYSATPPPQPTGVSATFFSNFILANGASLWQLTVNFAATTHENVERRIVEWSPTGQGIWQKLSADPSPAATTINETNQAWDDSTVYDIRVSNRNAYGLLSAPVIVTASTTQPGAPAAPSGLTAVSSGVRTKRWRWTQNAENNIAGYEFQVWTASGRTGTKKEPTAGDANGPHGFKRGTSFTYTESGMGRTATRYLSIRAKNRSGVVSAWTEASSAASDFIGGASGGATSDINPTGTGAIGGADVGTREITDPNGGTLTGYSVSTVNSSKIYQAVTLNGGVVLILVGGSLTFQGSSIQCNLQIRVNAGTTPSGSPTLLKDYAVHFINNTAIITLPLHAHHVYSPGVSGNYCYSVWMYTNNTPTQAGGDIALTVVEFKR